ncbi:hypothetical protein J6590_089496 [Homalodisca vitripennis]|nr:hypothetical protein J6590_089496 [Homalodisca vitripennis]
MCDELKPDVPVLSEHGYQLEMTINKGGVAIYVKNSVDYSPLKIDYTSELDLEAEGVTINNKSIGTINIIGLNRSPKGDFNINIVDQTKPLTKRLRDILNSFGVNWSVNSPSRQSTTYVITNISNVSVSVLNAAISDYFVQEVFIEDCPQDGDGASEFQYKRVVRPKNIEELNLHLALESSDFQDV